MHRSSPSTDDAGSAALEFILVGLLLLVPLVYLVVALGMIQGQALGAEAGARHIARAVSTATNVDDARVRADRVLASVAEEYGMDAASIDLSLTCVPAGGECPEPGATLVVTLASRVALPLVPPVLGLDRLASIPVEAGDVGTEGLALLGLRMRRVRRRFRVATRDDEGSVLLLTLGYAVLAIVAVLVCVDATSLYLTQKRVDAVADAAALAGADGFTLSVSDGEPRAELTDVDVRLQADALVAAMGGGASVVSAGTPDGVSARVTVAGTWHPPVLTLFVPEGVALEATATSRTALR